MRSLWTQRIRPASVVSTKMYKRSKATLVAIALLIMVLGLGIAPATRAGSPSQQGSSQSVPDAPQPQNQQPNTQQQPPDAPSAVRPTTPFPAGTKPAPGSGPRQPEPPANTPAPE